MLIPGLALRAPGLYQSAIAARHVLDKVGEYLEAGVRMVWIIDPRKAKAIVYRSLSDVTELQGGDALDGGEVLPGFRCPLRDVL